MGWGSLRERIKEKPHKSEIELPGAITTPGWCLNAFEYQEMKPLLAGEINKKKEKRSCNEYYYTVCTVKMSTDGYTNKKKKCKRMPFE